MVNKCLLYKRFRAKSYYNPIFIKNKSSRKELAIEQLDYQVIQSPMKHKKLIPSSQQFLLFLQELF